ncbi:MAG: hypothetical protein RML94_09715 [Bacteroidia bacterium]|nr:hypothetical protein [Bacteroidia bacterium]
MRHVGGAGPSARSTPTLWYTRVAPTRTCPKNILHFYYYIVSITLALYQQMKGFSL